MGDISVCGFDIDFVLCVRLYRFERRGGGRYKCEPLSQAIRTPRAAKSHRPLPHHHADRGSSSRNPHHQHDHLYLGIHIVNFCGIPSSCRSRLVINHPHHQQDHLYFGIHIINFCGIPSSCRSRLDINHRGIHIISNIIYIMEFLLSVICHLLACYYLTFWIIDILGWNFLEKE